MSNDAMQSVWILTSEVNDYSQHGKYFEAVFFTKPTREQLGEACNLIPSAEQITRLLETGGGRFGYEDVWYFLEEVSHE